jgi:hypothetical protein
VQTLPLITFTFCFQGDIDVFQTSRDTDEQMLSVRQDQQADSQGVCGVRSGVAAAVEYHVPDLRLCESAHGQGVCPMRRHRGRDRRGYGKRPQRPQGTGNAYGTASTPGCARRRAAPACRTRNATASADRATRRWCRRWCWCWCAKTSQRSTGALRPPQKPSIMEGEHHGYARSSKDVGLPGMRQA